MSGSFTDASQDGLSPYAVREFAIAGYNGTSIDRLKTTNGQLQIAAGSLTAGPAGASVNANPLKGVVYQNSIPLQASFTVGPLDVSLYRTLVIDWVVGATFTGTSITMQINSVDESGTVRAINSGTAFPTVTARNDNATPPGLTWILGVGANAPGTNGTTSPTFRYPDPFRRKITLVFTQVALSALTSTISVVGE